MQRIEHYKQRGIALRSGRALAPLLRRRHGRFGDRLKLAEAKELAAFALESESPGEIANRCQELASHAAPALFEK